MLSPEEMKLKVEALERDAIELGGSEGARFHELAMRWRLLGVEARYMDAVRAALSDGGPPT